MQVAFAIAGATLGAYFGPPGVVLGMSSAGLGWLAGSMVGQLWVTAHQAAVNTQGPRLSDMKVSAGGYGSGIPKTYGSPRVNGNVIWSSDLIETANTQAFGDKKTGRQNVTTYTYSVDCAVGVCEGPILGIRRIWANGKLIYDITGNGPVVDNTIIPLSGITFYTGTETQTASSVMQSRQGVDNVPAYRGLAYVVFENLQLKDFGNRHPKFDFEIGTGERLYIGIDYYNNKPYFSTDLVNWSDRGNTVANYPYLETSYAISNGFNQFVINSSWYDVFFKSTQNGKTWTNGPIAAINSYIDYFGDEVNRWIYQDGQYMLLPDFNTTTEIPYGAILTSSDGLTWNIADYFPTDYWSPGESDITDVIYSTTAESYVAVMRYKNGPDNTYFYASPKADRANFSLIGTIANTYNGYGFSYNLCEFDGLIWTVYEKNSTLMYWVASSSDGATWTDRYQVPDHDGGNSTYIAYILTDGQKLVLLYGGYYTSTMPNGHLYSRTSVDGDTWSGDHLIDSYRVNFLQKPRYDGRRFTWSDIYDGEDISRLFFSDDGENWSITDTGAISPDGLKDVMSISDGDFVQGTNTLSDVISDICYTAGLEPADIDTSALQTIDVKGYIRASSMAARSAIEPLLAVYDVDAFESDGKIKFLPKTSGYVGPAILESDLGASTSSQTEEVVDTVNVVRVQELELPNEITVRHIDRSLDYDSNQQYVRRLAGASQGSMTIDAPVVIDASEALNLANSVLYKAWTQRDQYTFSTTQKFAAYEPTDMFGIPFGGKVNTVRITKKEEDGFLINWSGVSEDLTIYNQNQTGSSGSNGYAPTIPMFCDTDLFVFEAPILRDQYDNLGYLAIAGGKTSSTWPGGNLFIVAENGTATTIALGQLPSRAVTGRLTTSLPAVSDPITSDWDMVNTFEVTIPWGQLESHTEAEVLAGMNTCIIEHDGGYLGPYPAPEQEGKWVEVLGFQTATLTSPGVYTISKLLRRIRQNSVYSYGGNAGSRFAMISLDTVLPVNMQLTKLNNIYTFAGPAVGTSLDSASTIDVQLTGMSKKPLSPILVLGSRLVNNDVLIQWTRRTRIGGSWPTGENGPLGELFEAYEVDIMAGDHTTVLRTLTSSTPVLTYSIADQITDFGSQTSSFEVNVYQMSDFIGRGYAANMIFHLLDAAQTNQPNESSTSAINQVLTITGNNCNQPNSSTTGAVS